MPREIDPRDCQHGFADNIDSNKIMKIPILLYHEKDNPIGVVVAEGGKLFINFKENINITRENLFNIFGGAGIRVIEEDHNGCGYIRKAQIFEFSLEL